LGIAANFWAVLLTLTAVPASHASDDDFFALPRPPERPLAGEIVPAAELSEELALAPASGASAAEIRHSQQAAEIAASYEADEEVEQPEPSLQFSLREMMLITFLAAVGFGVQRFFPPAMFAGAMGGIAILGLAFLSFVKPEQAIFHLIWWTMLGVYVVASIIAIFSHH